MYIDVIIVAALCNVGIFYFYKYFMLNYFTLLCGKMTKDIFLKYTSTL